MPKRSCCEKVEQDAARRFAEGPNVKLDLTRCTTAASRSIRASSPAAAGGTVRQLSPRLPTFCAAARPATANSRSARLSDERARVSLALTRNGATATAAGGRRDHQAELLRPVLRRRRRPGQQRPRHPPHDAQLPEPRGLEARRAASSPACRPHGRALHRRNGCQRRHASPPATGHGLCRETPQPSITSTVRSMTTASTTASARPDPSVELVMGPNIADWPEDVPR